MANNDDANNSRPLSAADKPPGAKKLRPVLHEPCSSTLAKYHDSINQSLVREPSTVAAAPSSVKLRSSSTQNLANAASTHNQTLAQHPILEAKQKYRYMVKTKSYVDESLFGSTSSRPSSASQWDPPSSRDSQYNNGVTKNHLTHQLMSNMAPLIHTPPVRSALNTERTDSARSNMRAEAGPNTQRPASARRPPSGSGIKPWRP